MPEDGSSEAPASGGSGNTIKIVLAVVILAAAGYFAYANLFSGGGNNKPTSAVDDAPEEIRQEVENEAKTPPVAEDEIGGA